MTKTQAEFIVENCDSNISMGLGLLQQTEDRQTATKLVNLLEQFKAVKEAIKNATTD